MSFDDFNPITSRCHDCEGSGEKDCGWACPTCDGTGLFTTDIDSMFSLEFTDEFLRINPRAKLAMISRSRDEDPGAWCHE